MKVVKILAGLFLMTAAPFAQATPAEELPNLEDYADDGFGQDLSSYFLFNVAYHGLGVGGGVQYAYPVLPSGIINNVNYRDALHLEGGLDIARWSWQSADQTVKKMVFIPQLGLRYAIYLSDVMAPYLSLKIGGAFAQTEGIDDSPDFFWTATGGLLWDLGDILSLRAEFGWGRYRDILRLGVLVRL